ncbi:cyclic nucleotide-binding domain-containing protein [Spirillospora sp. NPDC048911]|uniref:cyclic nucleotide-binding domain-containing protein n=1 Tax=Spirillospora sp. NPDC048911 TaxID=3364527 RepID=UPI0037138568
MLSGLGPVGTALLVSLSAGRADPVEVAAVFCAAALLIRWLVNWTRLLASIRDTWAIVEPAYQVYGPHGPGPYPGSPAPRLAVDPPWASGRPGGDTFWDSLSEGERNALRSVATSRTFALGATLFREGEQADFVVIIRSGRTKIYVIENGRERLLAERGPGQLIGERAALQVNVRSATVVAVDTVEALILTTPDFANFISAHPHVLGIVEGQIYDRLTERPGEDPDAPATGGHSGSEGGFPHLDGHHCTILRTDIVGFASSVRTADDRLFIQETHLAMTRESFRRAGIPWDACYLRHSGDELLLVAPPTVPTARVVEALGLLYSLLKDYHRRAKPAVQIRLRASVDVGPLTTNEGGPAGDPLIHSTRLLDAGVLRRSMAETEALLGVLASTYVYESVIKNMDPDGYRQVRAKVKETRLVAWMRLSGPALAA